MIRLPCTLCILYMFICTFVAMAASIKKYSDGNGDDASMTVTMNGVLM